MSPAKWDFYNDLLALRERINGLFDDNIVRGRMPFGAPAEPAWAPPVDAWETDSEVVVAAEIPGVDEKSVEVRVEGRTLTLRGIREMASKPANSTFHRLERYYGAFYRSIQIPESAGPAKMSVSYDGGVLSIRLSKRKRKITR
jgi:HSP20 family protein